jgi:hypothetical protein
MKKSTNIRKRKIKLAFPPMSSCFTITLVRKGNFDIIRRSGEQNGSGT